MLFGQLKIGQKFIHRSEPDVVKMKIYAHWEQNHPDVHFPNWVIVDSSDKRIIGIAEKALNYSEVLLVE